MLDEKWWAGSMECYCHLRNVQDLLSHGKTSCVLVADIEELDNVDASGIHARRRKGNFNANK